MAMHFRAILFLLFLFVLLGCRNEAQESRNEAILPPEYSSQEILPPLSLPLQENKEQSIEMKDDGFFPKSLSVAAGTNVLFVNKGSKAMWPASDNHPAHTLYPGSFIGKCDRGIVIFDACKEISPGGAWSFRFDKKGSWGYHDHRNPGMIGVVVVN